MAVFCPTCANILLVDRSNEQLRFFCRTCPYIFKVEKKVTSKTVMETKKADDVLGGKEAWANVEKTEAICPKCAYRMAYFRQLQIRSADEPMTTFYKCVQCSRQWREN
uniref:DNA-directed RNA polymerase subunit n=1 Tax=Chromera velia CCMP2878 TaxID=1169474 RepID=A0A0G4I9C6_9ALVE|mmetsp:Transcript_12145/g.23482  ORF Transcript_12145/g.23482 Transcript_12145/m.23482 type:complete len:108 (-) Transcript_12145:159-482(-)|eukprot:Cvel_2030.t1-p1 / transcript=Cvel_2030.t1 / gene=Cvel_2030 / organism=Chromera_velia_CCMP2878 / gene_product=DNA-directed RNA polymerase III subunit RPC10, putative / transcript_product=DNA-directed RNA polymerase III subunit RPC10, putative / location=Cvel_scaffold78:6193-7072(-) / protein_length=107 / sequence_SO=supercontig / SO=protein_coding / is_pseudo=false